MIESRLLSDKERRSERPRVRSEIPREPMFPDAEPAIEEGHRKVRRPPGGTRGSFLPFEACSEQRMARRPCLVRADPDADPTADAGPA